MNYFSLNLPNSAEKLFSQITSQIPTNKIDLSEVKPLQALGNVTIPFDDVLKGLTDRISFDKLAEFIRGNGNRPLKSTLGEFLESKDISESSGGIWGMMKAGLMLIANILVVVLELALKVLRAVLNLIA